jgi:hypothetical protein
VPDLADHPGAGTYSRDLHVAIQDSMGWFDYTCTFCERPGTSDAAVGIQMGCLRGVEPILPGWGGFHRPLSPTQVRLRYEYDFETAGNTRSLLRRSGARSIDHAASREGGPPEDCGGVGGYEDLMAVMRDPTHEEYESTRRWLGGGRFDPERFNARTVKFDHPGKRWDLAFGKAVQNRRSAKRRRPSPSPGPVRNPGRLGRSAPS